MLHVICLVIIMHMNSGAITLAGLYFFASSLSVIRNPTPYANCGSAKKATRVGKMHTEAVIAHFVPPSQHLISTKKVQIHPVHCLSSQHFKQTV